MELLQLFTVLFFLATTGITVIITESKMFSGIRRLISKLGKTAEGFIECPMFVGFWVGAGLNYKLELLPVLKEFINVHSFESNLFLNGIETLLYHIFIGSIASLIAWLSYCVTMWLNPEKKILEVEDEDEVDIMNLEVSSVFSEELRKEIEEKYMINLTPSEDLKKPELLTG